MTTTTDARRHSTPPDPTRHQFTRRLALVTARERAGLSVTAAERATGVRGLKAIEAGRNTNVRYALILATFYGLPVEAIWSVADA